MKHALNRAAHGASLALLAMLAACSGSDPLAQDESGALPVLEKDCSLRDDPAVQAMVDEGIHLASQAGLAAGRYALPTDPAPTRLVLMFHGHSNDSCSWRDHLRRVAARGAIAVAMDYSGQRDEPVQNYGWCVRAGAADSIAAAQHFVRRYPGIEEVIVFGVSMGGNVSGYALASPEARRDDGRPLFDWWIGVEGVHNLTQEYLIARGIAPANASGAQAVAEIEEENGGALEDVPDAYAEITNTARAADLATLRGAVLVHALDDGLVPFEQSREMATALNGVGVPTHLHTVLGNGGEGGDTNASAIPFDAFGVDYQSPFAGHAWEGSATALVMRTALDQLDALLDGAGVAAGETVVPGN